jgi:cyclic pyranopterin monophosphate synthase
LQGPVVQTAVIAATMAVKRTADLIPFCHPLAVEGCDVVVSMDRSARALEVRVTTSLHARTGVEMEAMVGASVAALTIYDMTKAAGKGITIEQVRLESKTGGKQDYKRSP